MNTYRHQAALDAVTKTNSHLDKALGSRTMMQQRTTVTMGGGEGMHIQLTQIPPNPRTGTVPRVRYLLGIFGVSGCVFLQ